MIMLRKRSQYLKSLSASALSASLPDAVDSPVIPKLGLHPTKAGSVDSTAALSTSRSCRGCTFSTDSYHLQIRPANASIGKEASLLIADPEKSPRFEVECKRYAGAVAMK